MRQLEGRVVVESRRRRTVVTADVPLEHCAANHRSDFQPENGGMDATFS